MEQDKRHIPQAGEPHNVHTKPANNPDKDKLRENPHNDERTISQKEGQETSQPDLKTGSTFARKEEDGQNRVTNEEEQEQIVNPTEKRWEDKASEESPESPESPDDPTPSKNPYEEIGDDPDEAKRKLPKM